MTALWLDLHPEVSSEPFAKSDGQAWFATAALLHLAFPFLFSASSVTLGFSFVPSRSLGAFTFPRPLAVMTHCSCHCHDNRLAAHMACGVFAVGFLRYTPCVWILDTWIWRTHSRCHSFCSHSAAVFESVRQLLRGYSGTWSIYMLTTEKIKTPIPWTYFPSQCELRSGSLGWGLKAIPAVTGWRHSTSYTSC